MSEKQRRFTRERHHIVRSDSKHMDEQTADVVRLEDVPYNQYLRTFKYMALSLSAMIGRRNLRDELERAIVNETYITDIYSIEITVMYMNLPFDVDIELSRNGFLIAVNKTTNLLFSRRDDKVVVKCLHSRMTREMCIKNIDRQCLAFVIRLGLISGTRRIGLVDNLYYHGNPRLIISRRYALPMWFCNVLRHEDVWLSDVCILGLLPVVVDEVKGFLDKAYVSAAERENYRAELVSAWEDMKIEEPEFWYYFSGMYASVMHYESIESIVVDSAIDYREEFDRYLSLQTGDRATVRDAVLSLLEYEAEMHSRDFTFFIKDFLLAKVIMKDYFDAIRDVEFEAMVVGSSSRALLHLSMPTPRLRCEWLMLQRR